MEKKSEKKSGFLKNLEKNPEKNPKNNPKKSGFFQMDTAYDCEIGTRHSFISIATEWNKYTCVALKRFQ